MSKEILLDETSISVKSYKEEKRDQLILIHVIFDVTSDEYHDITTLLYKGSFQVKVPERDLLFNGKIYQYSTSITNLYNKGNIGEFTVSLLEQEAPYFEE